MRAPSLVPGGVQHFVSDGYQMLNASRQGSQRIGAAEATLSHVCLRAMVLQRHRPCKGIQMS